METQSICISTAFKIKPYESRPDGKLKINDDDDGDLPTVLVTADVWRLDPVSFTMIP